MNENLVQFLWVRLQALFVSVVEFVCNSKDDFIHNIGRNSNAAFPLRAYLTFMKDKNGDEISITVDLINRDGAYIIETDICGGDGQILEGGPTIKMIEPTEKELVSWLEEYETFLMSKQRMVKEKTSALE